MSIIESHELVTECGPGSDEDDVESMSKNKAGRTASLNLTNTPSC